MMLFNYYMELAQVLICDWSGKYQSYIFNLIILILWICVTAGEFQQLREEDSNADKHTAGKQVGWS